MQSPDPQINEDIHRTDITTPDIHSLEIADKEWLEDEELPLVTAVMVTQLSRVDLSREAVACFRRQTYPNKRLLVIAQEPELVTCFSGQDDIDVLLAPAKWLLGDLRNFALDAISDGMVIQWDDDDHYHETRMEIQAAPLLAGENVTASFLTKQIVELEMQYYVRTLHSGIDGTIMHFANGTARYPATAKGEDTVFKRLITRDTVALIDNDPMVYIRRYHGANTWSIDHFRRIKGRIYEPPV